MANQEIYVRSVNDTEARGPFSMEQLSSLVEAGQITPDTYYYDATTEQWLLISSNAEMKGVLWPEKKRMGFKHKEFKAVNEDKSDSAPPITVQDFLAAAEGKTDETKVHSTSCERIYLPANSNSQHLKGHKGSRACAEKEREGPVS